VVDRAKPSYQGGSDLAYDYNTLRDEGLIDLTHLTFSQDTSGGLVHRDPGVQITLEGLQAVSVFKKSWLRKAIEQQPRTFVQVIVTILVAAITGTTGFVVGRYVTPAQTSTVSRPSTTP